MKLTVLMKSVICVTLSVFASASWAQQASRSIPYYGEEFYKSLESGTSDPSLRATIKKVLHSFHVELPGEHDLITEKCEEGQRCYSHQPISYFAARVFLMGNYYLVQSEDGYAIRDVYCAEDKNRRDFGKKPPAPNTIPDNRVINIEHTWPQSRFTRKFREDVQKSDLHHLFPTDSQVNAVRGNHSFGEVTTDLLQLDCPASRFGIGSRGTEEVFEPPQSHKGNVARALFYFAVRYDLSIDSGEEEILRIWNIQDPVDEDETRRNEEIFRIQRNRNPFVDFPDLADKILDF